jgi:hypothetical protein
MWGAGNTLKFYLTSDVDTSISDKVTKVSFNSILFTVYAMVTSCIGGGNQSTGEKTQNCHKPLANPFHFWSEQSVMFWLWK